MKKAIITLCAILSACAVLTPMSVSAKVGDVVGTYYSTDIKTILNGSEIRSINIGGQTLICAENMENYGFTVLWNPTERALSISSADYKEVYAAKTLDKMAYIEPGLPISFYYETDIVTTLDGKPITAYNIGGWTFIHAEAMVDFGYEVEWDAEERLLDITSPKRAGYVYTVKLVEGKQQDTECSGSFSIIYDAGQLTLDGDAEYFHSALHRNASGEYVFMMQFYQNNALFHSGELLGALDSLVTLNHIDGTDVEPSEKYDAVNEVVSFKVNGHASSRMRVIRGGGNGHVDFKIIAEGLPKFSESELEKIEISVSTGE